MRALVAGLLLLGPLAGCVSDAPATEVRLDPAGDVTEEPPAALPDNRSGTFNAFQETNRTETGVGGESHDHDYWKGRDRIPIIDRRESTNVLYFKDLHTDGYAQPAANDLVFEGTAVVEVLASDPQFISLVDAPPVAHPAPPTVQLAYRHPATTEWIDLGPIAWGTPIEIAVLPEQTDMPHSSYSLWDFRFTSDSAAWGVTFDFVVTIVRGTDVPKWPGHPDFYADGHQRVVFDGTGKTHAAGIQAVVTQEPSTWSEREPSKLISWGTRAVHVFVNVTKVTAPPGGQPNGWYLWYHNASGVWRTLDPVASPADPTLAKGLVFQIPVDDAGMDSPYATTSRWEFDLAAEICAGDPSGTFDCLASQSGFVAYDVEYEMRIVATDIPLPDTEAS